jgi:hypothetical protein
MPVPKSAKGGDQKATDEAAQAARERELREVIEKVEKEQSGAVRPQKESPHDYIERKMREEKAKK